VTDIAYVISIEDSLCHLHWIPFNTIKILLKLAQSHPVRHRTDQVTLSGCFFIGVFHAFSWEQLSKAVQSGSFANRHFSLAPKVIYTMLTRKHLKNPRSSDNNGLNRERFLKS